VLAVALYTLLMWQFLPLAVADAERAARLHLAGMWLTFVVSAAMIAWFVARMTASIRERDSRLAAAREQALRDERVVALGALAAGAAHELGTPLATIAVLVGELEQDPGARCRCARRPGAGAATRSSCARASSAAWRHAAASCGRMRCRHRMRVTGCAACWRAGRRCGRGPAVANDVAGRGYRRALAFATPRWSRPWPTCSTMRPMPLTAKSHHADWDAGEAADDVIATAGRVCCRAYCAAPVAQALPAQPAVAPASACCWHFRQSSAGRAHRAGQSRPAAAPRVHRTADFTEGAEHETWKVGKMNGSMLVIEDDDTFSATLVRALKRRGYASAGGEKRTGRARHGRGKVPRTGWCST
jgi:hypothetical protein